MRDKMQILKEIRTQVAHCLASSGDEPEQLIIKLEKSLWEWYLKGLNNNKKEK